MFKSAKDGKITVCQLLLPLSLVSFVLFVMLSFQASQILRDRQALTDAKNRQDKPLEETQKVQTQLDALATGTKKLADNGNKNAQNIIMRLKQLGITVNANKPMPGASAMTPATAPKEPEAAPAAAAPTPAEGSKE